MVVTVPCVKFLTQILILIMVLLEFLLLKHFFSSNLSNDVACSSVGQKLLQFDPWKA